MVIGYNESTNEVAVSDSWGPRYELRWVHLDIAKAVTSRGGFCDRFLSPGEGVKKEPLSSESPYAL